MHQRPGGDPRTPAAERRINHPVSHHLDALAVTALAVRVLVRDLVALLRRFAAAGVRTGLRELRSTADVELGERR
jgi:hypothetical protein